MAMTPIDVIVFHDTKGRVRPARFQARGRTIEVGRIISSEEARSMGGMLFIYNAESVVDGTRTEYRLIYDQKAQRWYIRK